MWLHRSGWPTSSSVYLGLRVIYYEKQSDILTDSIDAVPTGSANDRRDALYGVRQLNHRIN